MQQLSDDVVFSIFVCLAGSDRARASCTCKRFRRVARQVAIEELGLAEEQYDCFVDAMAGKNVFITGSAGCGKSHLLRVILDRMRKRKSAVVTATTGCAAAMMPGASTLHSAVLHGTGKADWNVIASNILEREPHTKARIRKMDVLVVDEAGMLTGKLLDKVGMVIAKVRQARKRAREGEEGDAYRAWALSNSTRLRPFDDVQLVLCGDVLQLPPVEVESQGWVFEAKCWERLALRVHRLVQPHRQVADPKFVDVLSRVRIGKATLADLAYLQTSSSPSPMRQSLKLFAVNAHADHENELRLAELTGYPHRFHAIDCAQDANLHGEVLDQILKHCLAPKLLILRLGCRVMCLKNINDFPVNGSIGTVVRIYPSHDETGALVQVHVDVEFDAQQFGGAAYTHTFSTHVVGKELDFANKFVVQGQDGRMRAQRVQLPLKLAWGISVHKSQGMTLDNVEIDFRRTFTQGQAYTALSRVKTLAGAHLKGLSIRHLRMAHEKAVRFAEISPAPFAQQ